MNKYFLPPNTAQIIPLIGSAIVVTIVDLDKMEGAFKIYASVEEARLDVHAISKAQHPEWHDKNCNFCKTGFGL